MKALLIFTLFVPSAFATGEMPREGFAPLAKKTVPAVVNISTYTKVRQSMNPYGDDIMRRFFEDFMNPGGGGGFPRGARPSQPQKDGPSRPLSLGTGFIVDSDGYILTNNHVIQQADEVKIQINEKDRDQLVAEIVGRDPELDVALLKVKTKQKLTALPLGDSDAMEVGDLVLAIGNPVGYGHTVTHGIVSAKGRENPELRLARYIQTDAPINPGNSGGPLLNMKGEVIGINNAIDARTQGIGFAIPSNAVKAVLSQLKTKGTVTRGYIGVSVGELTSEIAEQLGYNKDQRGVLVADVQSDMPAERAGIRAYDVITSVDGKPVESASDLTLAVTAVPVGQVAKVSLLREKKERVVDVKVGERPGSGRVSRKKSGRKGSPGSSDKDSAPATSGAALSRLGAQTVEIDANVRRAMSLPADVSGVAIVDVVEDGPADRAGLMPGDVILDLAGQTVKTVAELDQAARKVRGSTAILRIKRFQQNVGAVVQVVILRLK
jgi:serine protease Do